MTFRSAVHRGLLVPAAAFLLVVTSAVAQELPNSSFEEWTGSGKPSPFDWEEPTGWSSTNPVTEFTKAGVRRSGDAFEGSFACSIESVNIFGTDAPGVLVNGEPEYNFETFSLEIETAGTPYTQRPRQLKGEYQFSSTSAGDSGVVIVLFKRYDQEQGESEIIGGGRLALGPAGEYTSFALPITYVAEGPPDSVVVAFFSTDPENALPGGTLLVDDLTFDASSGVRRHTPLPTADLMLVPNPATDRVRIRYDASAIRPERCTITDILGRTMVSTEQDGSGMEIDLDVPPGLYTYRIEGRDSQGANLISTGVLTVR